MNNEEKILHLLEGMQKSITSMQNNIDNMQIDIKDLKAGQERLETRQGVLETNQKSLVDEVKENRKAIVSMENNLTEKIRGLYDN